MLVHGKFQMRFGIELGAWRDSGITPLWWVLRDSESFRTVGHWSRIKGRIDGVRSYSDLLYIAVRLRTGVDERGVIDDAVERMRASRRSCWTYPGIGRPPGWGRSSAGVCWRR